MKWFTFGLLYDYDKDAVTQWPYGRHVYSEYLGGECHLNTLLKGKALRTNENSLERRSLEMRINIKR